MLRVSFLRVQPEQVERLRQWMSELSRRKNEVRETFAQEKVHSEMAYLLETREGPVLVYAMEAEDLQYAGEAYKASTLPIDLEHGQVMSEIVSGLAQVELLYECMA